MTLPDFSTVLDVGRTIGEGVLLLAGGYHGARATLRAAIAEELRPLAERVERIEQRLLLSPPADAPTK